MKDRIDKIILAETSIDPKNIPPDKPITEIVSLDSMQFVSLMAKIEIELGIELPISMIQIKTMRDFYREIEGVIGNK